MRKPVCDFGPIESMRASGLVFQFARQATRLGLFDALNGRPLAAATVAERFGWRPEPTRALLEVLAAAGFLVAGGEGYRNAPLAAEFLVSSAPFFQGQALELQQHFDTGVLTAFAALLRGETDALGASDGTWATAAAMDGLAQGARLGALQDLTAWVADLPGFGDLRLLCDLGGNHGEYALALLDANPELRAEVYDLPEVARQARAREAVRGRGDRLTFVGLDLGREGPPPGRYDLVLASHVLYAFAADLEPVLGRIFTALRPAGWFVSHHRRPDGGGCGADLPAKAMACSTRLAGYPACGLDPWALAETLRRVGFAPEVRLGGCQGGRGALLAARRP